jgi:hypothetical protein
MSAKLNFMALALIAAGVGFAVTGCGGGGGGSNTNPITVSLSPSAAQSIDQGQTIQFTASVANDTSSKGVTWSQTGGALSSQTSTTATYTAGSAAGSGSVTATSAADSTKSATVNITIAATPSISATLANATLGTAYNQKISVSGGTGALTYSISSGNLPNGLSLNGSTGAITGTPTGPLGASNFTAKVVDSSTAGPVSATKAMTLTVNSAATLTITTTSLPNGALNAAYNATLQSTGGYGALTWSITSGTLPTGLSLNASTGAITGTPTVGGLSSLTFQVMDSSTPSPQTATATLSLTIPELVINTTSLLNPMVGEAYSQTLQYTDIGGGTTPSLTWSISTGALPTGFTINSSTGAISGTATSSEVGTTSFTVQVVDSTTQLSATQPLSLTITTATACGSGSESMLSGQYALSMSGFDSHGPVGMLASFTADGAGHITAGFEDINSVSGVQSDVSITTASSSYSVGADQRGCLTLVAGSVTRVFRFGLGLFSSGGVSQGGRTIEFDTTGSNMTGVIRIQNPPDFSNAAVTGSYAFGVSSPISGGGVYAAGGVLNLSGSTVTGTGDINNNGTLDNNTAGPLTFTPGTYSIASNGRGTLSFTPPGASAINLVIYVLYANQFFMMSSSAQSASNTLFVGDAQLQTGTPYSASTLNAPSAVFASGQTTGSGAASGEVMAGIFSPDGNGNYSFSGDQNSGGLASTESATGTYTVASNGRVLVTNTGGTSPVLLLYLLGANKGFVLFSNSSVMFGFAEPQNGGPFTNSSLTGTYAFATTEPQVEGTGSGLVALVSGVTSYASPTATVTFDYNQGGFLSLDNIISPSYTVAASGRVLTPASGPIQKVSYIIFPGKVLTIDYSPYVTNPTVVVMEQ